MDVPPLPSSINQKEKAGFVIRGGAYMLDSVIVSIGLLLLTTVSMGLVTFIGWLLPIIYFWVMTSFYGATLGKMFFGIKVITKEGGQIGWGKALLRELLGKIISSLVFSLGYFWVIWDKDKQGWHDKIAGTYVIQDKEIGKGKKILAAVLVYIVPVIMILGIGATIILIWINPGRQFELSNNTKRRSDVNAILNLVNEYKVDHRGELPEGMRNVGEGAVFIKQGPGNADICADLVPEYMSMLPVDPKINSGNPVYEDGCGEMYDTGYSISVSSINSRITVYAPMAELGEKIETSR